MSAKGRRAAIKKLKYLEQQEEKDKRIQENIFKSEIYLTKQRLVENEYKSIKEEDTTWIDELIK